MCHSIRTPVGSVYLTLWRLWTTLHFIFYPSNDNRNSIVCRHRWSLFFISAPCYYFSCIVSTCTWHMERSVVVGFIVFAAFLCVRTSQPTRITNPSTERRYYFTTVPCISGLVNGRWESPWWAYVEYLGRYQPSCGTNSPKIGGIVF